MLEATAKSKEPNMSLQRVFKDVVLRRINTESLLGMLKLASICKKGDLGSVNQKSFSFYFFFKSGLLGK